MLVVAKSVYGKVVYYVQGQEAELVAKLTGKKTVDKKDIEALILLGLKVEIRELA